MGNKLEITRAAQLNSVSQIWSKCDIQFGQFKDGCSSYIYMPKQRSCLIQADSTFRQIQTRFNIRGNVWDKISNTLVVVLTTLSDQIPSLIRKICKKCWNYWKFPIMDNTLWSMLINVNKNLSVINVDPTSTHWFSYNLLGTKCIMSLDIIGGSFPGW